MKEALKKIKVLAMDVDGVLTDGRIIIDSNGVETKNFDVQDGFGIVFLRKCGLKTAIISARESNVVAFRAQDLKIDKVWVGVYPKIGAYERSNRKTLPLCEDRYRHGGKLPCGRRPVRPGHCAGSARLWKER